jgi:hypothetical protein
MVSFDYRKDHILKFTIKNDSSEIVTFHMDDALFKLFSGKDCEIYVRLSLWNADRILFVKIGDIHVFLNRSYYSVHNGVDELRVNIVQTPDVRVMIDKQFVSSANLKNNTRITVGDDRPTSCAQMNIIINNIV